MNKINGPSGDAQNEADTAPSSSPNSTQGWLRHVPVLSAHEFPHAPTSLAYESASNGVSQARLDASPSYNLFLLNHEAYALPSTASAPPTLIPPDQAAAAAAVWQQRLSQHESPSVYPDPVLAQANHLPQDSLQTTQQLHRDPWTEAYTNLNRHPNARPIESPPETQLIIDPAIHALPPSHALATYESREVRDIELPQTLHRRNGNYYSPSTNSSFHQPVARRGIQNNEHTESAFSTSIDESTTWRLPDILPTDGINAASRPTSAKKGGRRSKRVQFDYETDEEAQSPPKRPRRGERPRGRRKGEIRGPRTVVDPSEDFMRVYNRALDAFVEKRDFDTAQAMVLQAIGINPEIFTAHSLLADIHFAKGNHEAGIDALMVGLHAHTNDVELWRQTADRILNVPDEAYKKRVERAMYCYSAILRKDGKDVDARFQRVECARILQSYNRAFSDIDILMQDDPHNSSILAQFASLCRDVNDTPKAKQVYEEHFEYYRTNDSSDDCYTWQDVSIYIDLLITLNETAKAISAVREMTRTLSGRQAETFWDEYPADDREFDQMHYPRRLEVPEFQPNKYPEHSYGEALPLDLRGRLGILRLKSGQRDEAQSHFQWLEPDLEGEESLVQEYSDTFHEVAKALFEAKEHEQALHFFEALAQEENIDLGAQFWLDMAASAVVCAKTSQAIRCYEQAIQLDADNIEARTELTKLYYTNRDRNMAIKYGNEAVVLAQSLCPPSVNRKYERKENRLVREAAENALKKAFRLPKGPGKEAGKVPAALLYRTRLRRRQFMRYHPDQHESSPSPTPERETEPDSGPVDQGYEPGTEVMQPDGLLTKQRVRKPRVSRPKVSKARKPRDNNLHTHYDNMQQLYKTLLSHQEAMREGEEIATNIWVDCAATMIEDFRASKALYPNDRFTGFQGYSSVHSNPRPSTPEADENFTQPSAHNLPQEYRRLAPQGVPDDFCGIRFQAWLDIFLELAIVYATATLTSDSQKECYKIITAALECTVFYGDLGTLTSIYSCYIACALALGDDLTLYNTAVRWFMREFAFCTDTYRLFQAITLVNELTPCGSGGKGNQLDKAVFKAGPNQKFAFRQIMSVDQLLPEDYNQHGEEGGVPPFMRKPREEIRKVSRLAGRDTSRHDRVEEIFPTATKDQSRVISMDTDANDLKKARLYTPKEMDVVLFVLYGQIMMANNSFSNALSYLYRAYCLDPNNCVCLLSMAFCYLHELFKRQTSNRHSYSLMGWAWFGKYEDARLAWARKVDGPEGSQATEMVVQEIEYNKARCWEMLGMADLGMRGYQKVLDTTATNVEGRDDWTCEAAYAMSVQYALNGNGKKARELTERYLTI